MLVQLEARRGRTDEPGGPGWAASLGAAEREQAAAVQALLGAGTKVNPTDDTSWTAVLEAGYYGHEAVVQARLATVANVDNAGVADETSLSLARGQGNPGIVALPAAGSTVRGGALQTFLSLRA